MDEADEENGRVESLLFTKCKCCLGDGDLKNLWGQYIWNGIAEIYGEMLSECFDITLTHKSNSSSDDQIEQICDSCIDRLRKALDFKREVLACEQLRYEHLSNKEQVKEELDNSEDDMKDYSNLQFIEGTEDLVAGSPSSGQIIVKEERGEEVVDFQDVEYLEIDEDKEDYTAERTSDAEAETNEDETMEPMQIEANRPHSQTPDSKTPEIQTEESDVEAEEKPKRKWPKKRKGLDKIYKKYTRDEMMEAVNAVRNGVMTKSEASSRYNVPCKTLTSWLSSNDSGSGEKNKSYYNFINDVKMILIYTNAVPFKTKSARYFCAYCGTDAPFFEDPDDLRIHTRTKHVDDRTRNTELILRPRYMNETLKLDINSLHCTVCCTILPTWPSMFNHLEENHKVKLKEARTKVIPYILKHDLKCALCSEPFSNFHNLDGHMNTHYSTYMCEDCGDTFLSAIRLSKHVKVHNTGRFPCKACGKVFRLEKYMQKHFDHVHKQEHNIKCLYCPEKFYGMFQRHLHLAEKHREKIVIHTCEYCGLRFEWKPYYVAHLRRKHSRKYVRI